MAGRGYVNPVPIEQRGWSTKRRPEKLTTGDRHVCGGMGAGLGLILWSFAYAILFLLALKLSFRPAVVANVALDPLNRLPNHWWWGGLSADSFALFGFLVGPERTMDAFEKILGWFGDRGLEADHHTSWD